MGRLLSGVLGLLVLAGCSVHIGGGGSEPARVPPASIDAIQYEKLLSMDEQNLRRRAQVGELGNCEVRNIGRDYRRCSYGDSFVIYLNHKSVYYPAMTTDSSDSAECQSAVDTDIKKALREGFCFSNHTVFTEMDTESLKRRAQAGDLGNCEVRNVGQQFKGCSYGDSFVVYLKNKGVYFPAMSTDASDSSVCAGSVGQNVKDALQAGLCL